MDCAQQTGLCYGVRCIATHLFTSVTLTLHPYTMDRYVLTATRYMFNCTQNTASCILASFDVLYRSSLFRGLVYPILKLLFLKERSLHYSVH